MSNDGLCARTANIRNFSWLETVSGVGQKRRIMIGAQAAKVLI